MVLKMSDKQSVITSLKNAIAHASAGSSKAYVKYKKEATRTNKLGNDTKAYQLALNELYKDLGMKKKAAKLV